MRANRKEQQADLQASWRMLDMPQDPSSWQVDCRTLCRAMAAESLNPERRNERKRQRRARR